MRHLPAFLLLTLFWPAVLDAQQEYFQQDVSYRIDVSLDTSVQSLEGKVIISYTNNSPDTLHEIILNLWANAYASDETPFAEQMRILGLLDFHFSEDYERGMTDIRELKLDGKPVTFSVNGEQANIRLDPPLLPGQQVSMDIGFFVKLPSARFSRLGYGKWGYYITQWFPKPAVYDRQGWHPMPYLHTGEFFSEFGNFEVSISVPEGYCVAASGEQAIDRTDTDNSWLYNFQLSDAHDFAWFAFPEKACIQLRDSVLLPGGRTIGVELFAFDKVFNGSKWQYGIDQKAQFSGMLENAKDALLYFDKLLGPYPYHSFTVVVGEGFAGGGMEYPGITLIDNVQDIYSASELVVHELLHNWFYGALGSNERENAWMDEGLTTYYTNRFLKYKWPERTLADSYFGGAFGMDELPNEASNELGFRVAASRQPVQSATSHAASYDLINYAGMVYFRSMRSFQHLEAMMGSVKFDAAIREYYALWKFRHPGPEVLKTILGKYTGANLDWFFEGLLSGGEVPDYCIFKVRPEGDSLLVTLHNHSHVAAPTILYGLTDGSFERIQVPGFTGVTEICIPDREYSALRVGNEKTIDRYEGNDTYRFGHPIFRKAKLQASFLYSLPKQGTKRLFYTPIIGCNANDGVLAGLGIYNDPVLNNGYRFRVVPMYGFNSGSLSGTAGLEWRIPVRINGMRPVMGVSVSSFSRDINQDNVLGYTRRHAYLRYERKPGFPVERKFHSLELSVMQVNTDMVFYHSAGDVLVRSVQDRQLIIARLNYSFRHDSYINPYGMKTVAEFGKDLLKVWAEADYRFSYTAKNKGVNFRIFAGSFFIHPEKSDFDMRFTLGGYSGRQDYLFERYYFDRSAYGSQRGIMQTYTGNGNFRILTPYGQTWDHLVALNVDADFPGRLPLSIFLDAGTWAGAGGLKYDAGISLILIRDMLEIHFPLLASPELMQWTRDYLPGASYRINLTFDPSYIDPWKVADRLLR